MNELEELIAEYQPNSETLRLVADTKIVLLVGISGAGKDTIKRRLLRSPEFRGIVSYTTRLPRRNQQILEQNGVDYNFIDDQMAYRMLQRREFVEAKFVHGTVYGTGLAELQTIHQSGAVALNDVDVQGVDEYKKLSQGVVAIFLLPPNYTEWRRRLSVRYATRDEFEKEWPKRYNSAIRELTRALEVPYYHFVINDSVDETARIVREIALRPDMYNRKDDEARLAARDLLEELQSRQ